MTKHLYLSLMPEALIASMLSAEEFGRYYAIGSDRKVYNHNQAIFIELDPEFRSEDFRIEEGLEKCVPHDDGSPKKSVYISVYRVLERLPLTAMGKMYLVTSNGQVLGIDPCNVYPEDDAPAHMYQEIAPVQPLVVSTLAPKAFADFISQENGSFVHLPATAFAQLRLGQLAEDPELGAIQDLPYDYIPHLRECLIEIQTKENHTKMVHRVHPVEFPYRMVENGLFIAKDGEGMLYYPMPSKADLRSEHYRWWRSANQ